MGGAGPPRFLTTETISMKLPVIAAAATALFLVAAGGANAPQPAAPPPHPPDLAPMRYAADRAEIENLEARHLFALDWQDADAYASAFAPEGVLDWAGGIVNAREAIRKEVVGMRATFAKR